MNPIEILIMIGQLLLGLSFLVAIHEGGHMVAAKLFGMRVEKFFIGFPPKVYSFKKGETEYGIGSIPLGGFVKISGMVDESFDTDGMKKSPEPWEFRAKPTWQRLIVILGGIIVNMIAGVIIMAAVFWVWGEEYLPAKNATYGIVAGEYAQKLGLKTGDQILNVSGAEMKKFSEVYGAEAMLGDKPYYTVQRGDSIFKVYLPANLAEKLQDKGFAGQFVQAAMPYSVKELVKESPAQKAGLKPGDKIVTVNGKDTRLFHELRYALLENKGQEVTLGVTHANGQSENMKATVSEQGTLGFYPESGLTYETQTYGFFSAIPRGVTETGTILRDYVRGLGKIFKGEVAAEKSVSGLIGMATLYGGTWQWDRFWQLTGVISIVLAFMNFLPIPALDGGHMMFILYEMVTRREPSIKVLLAAQKVGVALVLSLMVFAFYADIMRLVK